MARTRCHCGGPVVSGEGFERCVVCGETRKAGESMTNEGKALEEQLAELASGWPWYGDLGDKTLGQAIKDELTDYEMLIGNTTTVFCEVTRGRISKPNTLASEVIGVVNELQEDEYKQDLAEDDFYKLGRAYNAYRRAVEWHDKSPSIATSAEKDAREDELEEAYGNTPVDDGYAPLAAVTREPFEEAP
jgi:hypothetical protein